MSKTRIYRILINTKITNSDDKGGIRSLLCVIDVFFSVQDEYKKIKCQILIDSGSFLF